MRQSLNKADRRLLQAAWKRNLEVAMPPTVMAELVTQLHDQVGPRLMVDAGWGFFREAFVAAEFSKKRGAASVRLLQENRPDFEIELNGKLLRFEVTEADDPDRRRSAEYKAALPVLDAGGVMTEADPQEASERRISLIPEALAKAAAAKAGRTYDRAHGLVIRLNLSGYDDQNGRALKWLGPSTHAAADAFSEIWVLWAGNLFRVWENGRSCSVPKRWSEVK